MTPEIRRYYVIGLVAGVWTELNNTVYGIGTQDVVSASSSQIEWLIDRRPFMLGDANLDNSIDFDDYIAIDTGYNSALIGWENGDFDLNGVVDFDDYVIIDAAYNGQGNSSLAMMLSILENPTGFDPAQLVSPLAKLQEHAIAIGSDYVSAMTFMIPEPMCASAVLGASLLTRRRQRQ